ncbi:SBBP repeat-containing protein [Hymenobacter tibetensis]|uniref:SBBP repeat-containing protein n=1 Tax=Hymenobacter tibetensis TaxID=497967 RepID=A0ABY4CT17_9BACT|nr:SBBP repeat-containing protein [Hymenobacter tibetensis]UOG73187.1 SBBP repeat-containing protein [Hymenobacter tibetensis]
MKQAFTRLLPVAAGLLLYVPTAQAQNSQRQAASRESKSPLTQSSELVLPTGAPALRHALPLAKGTAVKKNILTKHALTPTLPAERKGNSTKAALASGPVTGEWVARYAGDGNSYDGVTSVVADAAGNTYVTGYSFQGNTYDYATVKYSPSGQQLWTARYNGGSSGDDIPTGVAVDAAGNVYVTGYSYGTSSTSYNYATVKYSSTGQQLWATIYTSEPRFSTISSDDLATSLAVDAAGNVYVTGSSFGANTAYDYATVKYSSSGQQVWVSRYTGSGFSNESDVATKLVLDGTGNVYVTGTSYRNSESDYATVKYNNSGQQLWVSRYNGPANGYDLVRDVAVDGSGTVYVTGTSDAGSSYDYATVRYSANGQQLWVARYNGAGNTYDEATALATDGQGNVVVTGYADTGSGYDYTTLKYTAASGQQAWVGHYNGPDNSYDEARDVAIDANNNIFVTGRSYNGSGRSDYATVKYAANGQQVWASRYSGTIAGDQAPTSLAVDGSGNVAVSGASPANSNLDIDYATVKYAGASGQQLWVARYTGPSAANTSNEATDLVADAAGNVYVTGSSYNGSNWNYLTIKYSASGQQLWVARLEGRSDASNSTKIALDAAGNVFVTGRNTYVLGGTNDYTTLKYDGASGQQLWVATYGTSTGYIGTHLPTDIAVDAAGNVVITGTSYGGASTSDDYATVKYNGASGQQLWATRYTGPGNGNDEANALALDATGNVYVTGAIDSDEVATNQEYATIKYSASGQQLWEARYAGQGPGRSADVAKDIAVDAAGDVYVTGETENSKLFYNEDYATVKYAGASGQQLWVAIYNSSNDLSDSATDLVVDALGNVYVAGTSYSDTSTDADYTTVKYAAASGQQLWEARYAGITKGFDQPSDLTVDAAGDVYITGNSNEDYATVKYAAASGQQLWEVRYNGPNSLNDAPASVAVNSVGNVFVTGASFNSAFSNADFATIKYVQASGSTSLALATVRATSVTSSKHVQDLSVYPNPMVGQASVSFRPVQDGAAQVLVYNQQGRQVASLYNGTVHKGQRYTLALDGQKLAPGLYTCSLLVDGKRETVRLVINK